MSYDRNFNNTLAIWTAFGGRGSILLPIPTLSWSKKYYNDFGYSQYGGVRQIDIYDNGNAQIAVYFAQTPYMSYYNKTTKRWTIANVPWWSHGKPDIVWAGDGVFLACIVGLANIIASFDGITWYNAGFCDGAKNEMICGAYDSSNNCGIVSWWYYKTPLYYSYDSLKERTEWTLVGADGVSVPAFRYLTAHKGTFFGITETSRQIARASPNSPGSWFTTIYEDLNQTTYMNIRSVGGKLFVMKYNYIDGKYHTRLCLLNDTGTEITETNLFNVGGLADNNIHNPNNIIWMKDWGKYAIFSEEMLYVSADGLYWEGTEQPGLKVIANDNFEGAIYIPGDGFYIRCTDYVYYAPY